jgi:hypothetical protein
LVTDDEWDANQAWPALIAYESIKKMRIMDYDGFSWCCLRGGPNTATYQKSLTDYEGVAKLAFYAHNMAFQNTFAGSDNVDVVYWGLSLYGHEESFCRPDKTTLSGG